MALRTALGNRRGGAGVAERCFEDGSAEMRGAGGCDRGRAEPFVRRCRCAGCFAVRFARCLAGCFATPAIAGAAEPGVPSELYRMTAFTWCGVRCRSTGCAKPGRCSYKRPRVLENIRLGGRTFDFDRFAIAQFGQGDNPPWVRSVVVDCKSPAGAGHAGVWSRIDSPCYSVYAIRCFPARLPIEFR